MLLLPLLLFLGHQSVYGQTVTPTPDELFFPLIGAERSPLRPQFLDGVAGILEQGTEVRFAHTFQSGTGEIYLIVGATTEIEQKISNLIPGEPAMGEPAGAAPIEAMVTGEVVYMDSGYPLIIASDIVSVNEGPENGPPTTGTKFSLVNLMVQPNWQGQVAGKVTPNDLCTIVGRDQLQSWWLAECANGVAGWAYGLLFDVNGNIRNVPVVTQLQPIPDPTATPTVAPTSRPQPIATATAKAGDDSWQIRYYNNPDLLGVPVATDTVSTISFNWGEWCPAGQCGAGSLFGPLCTCLQF